MNGQKQILIIGAGPSGLVTAKEAMENGLDPMIFEKTAGIGGLWNPNTGGVWPSMNTNLSKYTCSFTGFPWPSETPMFPSSGAMYNYLLKYAENFDLLPRIQFTTTVINIVKISEGWLVQWRRPDQSLESGIFRGVLICTGIFSSAYIPDIPGLSDFTGRILHSKDYRGGESMKNKSVLVIGGAISGEQVASDLSHLAKRVIHNFKKPFWLINPYMPQNSSETNSPLLRLDFLFYTRKFYLTQPANNLSFDKRQEIFNRNSSINAICQPQQSIPELHIPESSFNDPINVTRTNQYLDGVKNGTIQPKQGIIQRIGENKIIFDGGEEISGIDAIVFSTGFKVNVPFLSPEIRQTIQFDQDDQFQPMILNHATLHPDLPGLFFVGMYKGPYFAVMELQARWACRLLSQKICLPSREKMLKGLDKELEIRNCKPRGQFPHPDYVRFADEIAELAGSFPDLVKLNELELKDSLAQGMENLPELEKIRDEIYDKFMTSPVIPEHYNLFEKPEEALLEIDKAIAEINDL